MKQFDVVCDDGGHLFCIVQHGLLLDLPMIMVVPLERSDAPGVTRLIIPVEIDGIRYLFNPTQQIALRGLVLRRAGVVASLDDRFDDLREAIHTVYSGV